GDLNDVRLLRTLADGNDVVSFDWENVSVSALAAATRGHRVAPPLRALAAAQDRIAQKRTFERLSIPTTRFASVETRRQLERAIKRIGLPGVLKTRRLGYDGKGQYVLRAGGDIDAAWSLLGGVPLLYEEFVPFDCELSVIGARARDGTIVIYPLS